ncbi:MAG: hypothetical protein R3F45_06730 [Gammaproteobacteria bacterium]
MSANRRGRKKRAPSPRRGRRGAAPAATLERLLERQPQTEFIEVLFADINGMLRGKRVGREEFHKVFGPGVSLPGAAALLDSKGMTSDAISNGSADGDPDMICRPVAGTTATVPWAMRPTAQTMVSMYDAKGEPYFADSRHVLEHAMEPLAGMGLKPVVAIELEFYLLDGTSAETPRPRLGRIPGTSLLQDGPQYNSLDDLADLDAYFAEVDAACREQGIPASAALAEFAPGQYEINLHHIDDPLLACAHALMLKRVVKSVARRHGMGACFMAKPFAESAGSGMHVHVSLRIPAVATSLPAVARAAAAAICRSPATASPSGDWCSHGRGHGDLRPTRIPIADCDQPHRSCHDPQLGHQPSPPCRCAYRGGEGHAGWASCRQRRRQPVPGHGRGVGRHTSWAHAGVRSGADGAGEAP